ncbi:hypothetical protein PYW08_010547 [Mythimna loreyi]|uniref:Uncharacterized protein n=1 Tax=Mythimna loreyi TaxID=667449 RepID=A0ACC2Q531_9NEOP|nr:hypothetical protein PYW08_010547 [Mythimna loreyi]
MSILRNILCDILSDTSDCCCLCFSAIGEYEDIYNFEDEVSMGIEIETTRVLHEMICTVLGFNVSDSNFAHNIVCQKCTITVTNCYKFIQQCKQNIEKLHSAIDSLQKHTQENVPNYDYKSLFVALDTSNNNVEFYHHKDRKSNNQTILYKRFKSVRYQHKKKSALKRKHDSILHSIEITNICDILRDEDDCNLKFFFIKSLDQIIMPRIRHHMNMETASRAVVLLQEGGSQRAVASRLGVSRRAIRNAWERFQETGSVARRRGSGRTRSTTAKEDRYLRLSARQSAPLRPVLYKPDYGKPLAHG